MSNSEIGWQDLPDAGSYDTEDGFVGNSEIFDKRKIKIVCPGCKKKVASLCSSLTMRVESGWRWVGFDYKEPYSINRAKCGKCGTEFKFTLYTPQ